MTFKYDLFHRVKWKSKYFTRNEMYIFFTSRDEIVKKKKKKELSFYYTHISKKLII